MRVIRKDGSFFVPKGALADPRDARNRESSASGAARRRGILSFSKESIPLKPPRERTRGLPPRPHTLADRHLKSCAACGIGCGVRGFATGPYVSSPLATAPYYREARVTIARRRTACWRHCCAHRRTGAKNDRVSGRFYMNKSSYGFPRAWCRAFISSG